MIIGSLLEIKLKDINNEVLILFVSSIIDCIFCLTIIGGSVITLWMIHLYALGIAVAALFLFPMIWWYSTYIMAGIYVLKFRKYEKKINKYSKAVNAQKVSVKRENHYASEFAGDRYYRYCFLCEWTDYDGKMYQFRSKYYDEVTMNFLQNQGIPMKIYFIKNNYKTYVVVPDIFDIGQQ